MQGIKLQRNLYIKSPRQAGVAPGKVWKLVKCDGKVLIPLLHSNCLHVLEAPGPDHSKHIWFGYCPPCNQKPCLGVLVDKSAIRAKAKLIKILLSSYLHPAPCMHASMLAACAQVPHFGPLLAIYAPHLHSLVQGPAKVAYCGVQVLKQACVDGQTLNLARGLGRSRLFLLKPVS